MNDEFFIGWQGKAPEKTGGFLKKITLGVLVLALMVAGGLAAFQGTIAEDATFEFGNTQEFEGILVKEPVPMLVGERAVWYLVNPFKYGFDPAVAEKFHLQKVKLEGTLIARENKVMIEALPDSVKATSDEAVAGNPLGPEVTLGETTLRGEIVDSKCYLGVMNPGNLKTHRACAVNCIAGGIPPVLLVRNDSGEARYILLVGEKGEAINEDILPLVAEPVAVTGELRRRGEQLILFASAQNIVLVN